MGGQYTMYTYANIIEVTGYSVVMSQDIIQKQ